MITFYYLKFQLMLEKRNQFIEIVDREIGVRLTN